MRITRGRDILDLTPEEYIKLIELEAVRVDRANGSAGGSMSEQRDDSGLRNGKERLSAGVQPRNGRFINSDIFFKKRTTSSMARIMLAFLAHEGKVTLSELLGHTRLKSGSSLRKPNGALNDRIRAASSNRIHEFYIVQINSVEEGGDAERVYVTTPEVLDFISANESRIRAFAESSI